MKKKKNIGIQELNKLEKVDNINTINEYLEILILVYRTLIQTINRQKQTIKDLKKKVNQIESDKNFWYEKCVEFEKNNVEYRKIPVENKIPYDDLPL